MKTNKVFAVAVMLAGLVFSPLTRQIASGQDAPPDAQEDVQGPPPQDQQGPPQDGQGQDQNDQQPAQDPPGRVAQLAYSSGSISFQPSGQGDWVQAVTNRPLTAGDNLWADKDSRAELHIGSTTLRMDSETSITFLDLDDHSTQIKLSMGSLIVRVRHLDDGDTFEIDTPNLAFNLQRTGEYRLDVNADGNVTNVAVWQGRGEATGGGDSYMVVAGQQAKFSGTDQLDHEIAQLPGNDDFDGWSSGRDQADDRSDSANYVSDEMTGYQDLDEYGSWSYQAGYGAVWAPSSVAVDWAPYRYGHWVWIAPWGWTWVEDEPWGFAPFHYGRWANVSNRWFWVPGRVFVRPVYAPALVAFVGGGGFHIGVGVGGPGVGWFPLAPGEVYMPWYRTSRVYVNSVNITNTRVNVTQVTNVYNVYNSRTTVNNTRITYVNQRVNNAVTAVPRDTFVNSRPVGRSFVRVDEKQLASAQVNYRPEEQPARTSVMGSGAPARFQPPATVVNRQVVATRVPTIPRTPFGQSRPAVNVRTEQSASVPQPARSNVQQPEVRGGNVQQPQTRYEAERPAQPQYQSNVPRPGYQQPNNQARPQQPNYQQQEPQPRPLVRSAPPVQDRPDTQRSEQQKFQSWQQQRPRESAPRPQPQHEERSAPRSSPPPEHHK